MVLLVEDELIIEARKIVQLVAKYFVERNEDEHQEIHCHWLELWTCLVGSMTHPQKVKYMVKRCQL